MVNQTTWMCVVVVVYGELDYGDVVVGVVYGESDYRDVVVGVVYGESDYGDLVVEVVYGESDYEDVVVEALLFSFLWCVLSYLSSLCPIYSSHLRLLLTL